MWLYLIGVLMLNCFVSVRDEESIIRTCGSAEHRKAGDDEAYSPSKKGGYCYTTVMEEYNTEVNQHISKQPKRLKSEKE